MVWPKVHTYIPYNKRLAYPVEKNPLEITSCFIVLGTSISIDKTLPHT